MRASPFQVRGRLTVRDSATIICARRVPTSVPLRLSPKDLGGTFAKMFSGQKRAVFGASNFISFLSGWEVLMGQSEVINYMKTRPTHDKPKTMRYGGEYKLPGGMVETNESARAAAARELSEEFLIPSGTHLNIRPFTVKQTRPIRSRSNMMICYIALESENEWLKRLDVSETNRQLRRRREKFTDIVRREGEHFFKKSKREREKVTPEVHELRWMSLRDAVRHSLSSLCQEDVFVNEFQRTRLLSLQNTHTHIHINIQNPKQVPPFLNSVEKDEILCLLQQHFSWNWRHFQMRPV